MRTLLWALLLGSIVGCILLWLSDQPEDRDAGVPGDEGGAVPAVPRDEGTLPVRDEARDVILVEDAGAWPPDLLRDGAFFVDPRAVDEIEVVSPTGKEHTLTGAELLVLLEREFRGTGFQFRFKDAGALEAFKSHAPGEVYPAHAPLRIVLDGFAHSGFAFVAYAGKIYVTPIEPGVLPGAEQVPAVPIEGVEPEAHRPK